MPIKPQMHPELFTYFSEPEKWKQRFLTPELRSKNWDLYAQEEITNIYTIPAFTEEFCDFMIDEAEASNRWTVDRHDIFGHVRLTCSNLKNHNGLI